MNSNDISGVAFAAFSLFLVVAVGFLGGALGKADLCSSTCEAAGYEEVQSVLLGECSCVFRKDGAVISTPLETAIKCNGPRKR